MVYTTVFWTENLNVWLILSFKVHRRQRYLSPTMDQRQPAHLWQLEVKKKKEFVNLVQKMYTEHHYAFVQINNLKNLSIF